MTLYSSIRLSHVVLIASVMAACGGRANTSDDDETSSEQNAASGGEGMGAGSSVAGDGGTTAGSGGRSGTGGEGLSCCAAVAICADGEMELSPDDECPDGYDCHENSICCSIVQCAVPVPDDCDAVPTCRDNDEEVTECPEDASCYEVVECNDKVLCLEREIQCKALPSCDEGDRLIEGVCPPDGSCYTKTLCGSTINCRSVDDETCDTDDPNREYIADTEEECSLILFTCPIGTSGFSDDCGCGCEQPSDCPEVVQCVDPIPQPEPVDEPEPTPDRIPLPACDDNYCPYSLR